MLRTKFFRLLAHLATSRGGWWLIGLAMLVTVAAAILAPRLPILTTREGMVDSKLSVQKDYVDFSRDFGAQNQLVVLIQGEPTAARKAADALAAALTRNSDFVSNVFYRVDIDALRASGLYYLPLPELEKATVQAEKYAPLAARALARGSWLGLLQGVAEEAQKAGADFAGDNTAMARGFAWVDGLLGRWQAFLEKPDPSQLDLAGEAFTAAVAKMGGGQTDNTGYFVGDGGHLKVMFVQQAKSIDNTEFIVPFMRYCRDAAAQVTQEHPGVTIGFTGWPVSIEEEIALVKGDLARVLLIATVVIFFIVLLALRSLHRTLLMFVPVALSILWNFGLTLFTVGSMNYLTSAFVGILFGLGIDYGVVFMRRYDEELAAGLAPAEAITNTLLQVGPSVTYGALATIGAFFAVGATKAPAFSELGIVAGTGIICAISAALFVMPKLMHRFPPKPRPGVRERHGESLLLRRVTERLLPLSRPLVIAMLAVVVALGTQIPRLRFDYNLNNMLPVNSETVRIGTLLETKTGFNSQFISVIADDLPQAARLAELLRQKPTVARIESLVSLIPPDQEKKQALLPRLAAAVQSIAIPRPAAPDVPALRAEIAKLLQAVNTAQEQAFSAGKTELISHLDRVIKRFQAIDQLLATPAGAQNEAAFEAVVFDNAARLHAELLRMLAAPPVTMANIDPNLRDRFVGLSGRQVLMVFPKQEIWDLTFLDRFVADVRGVAAQVFPPMEAPHRVSGFGVVYQITTRLIHNGFVQASWTAALVVLLLVAFDYRRVRPVLLTLMPLAFAVVISLGGMALMGRPLNMASQLYLPILLGIGIDYGILMTHRWDEPDGIDLPRVVATMGNALWLACATAVAGFGALVLARHRGLITFGQVLSVAIVISMVLAVFATPLFIQALRLDRRAKK